MTRTPTISSRKRCVGWCTESSTDGASVRGEGGGSGDADDCGDADACGDADDCGEGGVGGEGGASGRVRAQSAASTRRALTES
eukprot:2303574-Pleurochrysis_carterae.AAC.2